MMMESFNSTEDQIFIFLSFFHFCFFSFEFRIGFIGAVDPHRIAGPVLGYWKGCVDPSRIDSNSGFGPSVIYQSGFVFVKRRCCPLLNRNIVGFGNDNCVFQEDCFTSKS